MPAGSRAALVLVLVLALATGAVWAQTATDPGTSQISPPESNATTSITIQIQSNGDARWSISAWFNLTSDSEREAFRQLATEFRDGETSTLGLPAYRTASDRASEATGREMSITAIERSTAPDQVVENGTGRLTLSFTWTNFTRVDGDRIHVGDVFDTARGTWFPGLDEGQTLVVKAPPRYSVFDASVPPQNGTLQWSGPATFGPSTLDATFTGVPDATPTPTPVGPDDDSGAWLWLFVATAGLGAGAAVLYFVTSRDGGFDLPAGASSPDSDTDESMDAPSADTAQEGTDEGEDSEEPDEPEVDLELLSDEERVEHLLEQNGGRMKQASIVKETGWSNAKVSQLLSSMEEDGQINKLRIGRENLISFPDEDVTDFED
jgi:hypothetical protein